MNKRIKIKSRLTLTQLILLLIFFLSVAIGAIYFSLTADNLSHKSSGDLWGLVSICVLAIPMLFMDYLNKDKYLSDISITEDEIIFYFKEGTTLVDTVAFDKIDIKSFNLNVCANLVGSGKHQKVVVDYNILVDLYKGNDISTSSSNDFAITEGGYKFLYRLLPHKDYIPNFKFNFKTNSPIMREEIDYFIKHKKPIPFWLSLKTQFKLIPKTETGILYFFLTLFVIFMLWNAYLFIPPYMTKREKQYLNAIDNTFIIKNDPNRTLIELDKARKHLSTDPYLYLLYAQQYKKLKDYRTAIYYAELGIKKLGNKEVYYSQFKLTKPKTEVFLYRILAECSFEISDWENSIKAYTAVINSKNKWKYTDAYFYRGRAYFEARKFQEAKKDFVKQKEIILAYLKKYPKQGKGSFYTKDKLNLTIQWIVTCDAWRSYYKE